MIDLDVSERACDDLIGHGLGYLPPAGIGNSVSIKELIARLRQAEKDADRYRWVIEQFWFQDEASWRLNIKESELSAEFSDDVGRAIDEAMQCKG